MAEPSVKGTIFKAVADEINGHLAAGEIEREDLAPVCKPADLEFLEREIAIASWYPVDTYGRYLRFLCDRFGRGQREYLMEGGRQSAQRVIDMGVYGQLDDRTERWDAKVGRVLVTLGGSFYNFGEWVWEYLGEEGFRIEVRGVAAFPEEAAIRAHGFVELLTSRAARKKVNLEYERPTRSLIVFRSDVPS